jgi:VWFA-related protein
MTAGRLLALLVLLQWGPASAAIGPRGATPQQTPPVFRAKSTLVSVEVSVRSGNNTVEGLGPDDFRLTDNGVPQKIELVDLDAVPVDVSLVVDVSGSTSTQLEQYKADVRAIAKTIRAQDRLRVITFATDPKQVMALQPAGAIPEVDDMNAGPSSSVYDGIAAALIRRVDLDRRHLIVAFTDGKENSSILTLEMLMGLAKQSEAVLHLAGSAARELNEVADATGGANHLQPLPVGRVASAPAPGSMLRDFNKIFAAFRQSYVLRFQPAGVTPAGWHDLKVTVPGRGRVTIQARRGYFGG